jgi:ribosomal protein L34
MTKGTLQGTKRHAIKVSGFRARSKTYKGAKILNSRRKKGRRILTKMR